MKIELQSRHSDYGEDAGGYTVLKLDGVWIGRVEGPTARLMVEELIKYIQRLEEEKTSLKIQLDAANLGWA